ncbi:MAG: hypothetical protein KDI68_04325 [Gammaproteobacteria bacterium]|nr:hypothetical protein [Gammaproteobacteria bacterium]
MADSRFSLGGYLIRFLFALVLVFATYSPAKYNWYRWFMESQDKLDPLLILSGVILLIGWTIYLRATLRSLGIIGAVLAGALFGAVIWLLIGYDLLSLSDTLVLQYVVLIMVAVILATGISWSHIRRRLTGQIDVDDVDE